MEMVFLAPMVCVVVVVLSLIGMVVVVVMVVRMVPFLNMRLAYDDSLKWPKVPPPP